MEILTEDFHVLALLPLGMIAAALLCARLITPLERSLIGATATLLAGMFFVTKAVDPLMSVIGIVGWAVGLGSFIPSALQWSERRASHLSLLAGIVMLPPAFFGAFLLGGMLISMLAGPARLLARVVG